MIRVIFTLLLVYTGSISPLTASGLKFEGNFVQGGLVTGTVPIGSKVLFDGHNLRISAKGHFLIGFSRGAQPTSRLEIILPNGKKINKTLNIDKRDYPIQRIDGLPQNMVVPPKSVYSRIARENAEIARARNKDMATTYFKNGWIWPTHGRITGIYGSQRILNGKARQPHYGIDIAAPIGTPVVSPAPAIVTLTHQNMYYTGGTVILDHGHGLTSAMLHMNHIEVAVGDFVRKGQSIGTVGKSGRATGPHLDWRINLFNARIDPALLVPPMPKPN